MRSLILAALAALALAGCESAAVQQAVRDTRHDAVRADSMLAVAFRPGTSQLDPTQTGQVKEMVASGRRAQRDEFVVVSDGSGGAIQGHRAQQVKLSLSNAGARWVDMAVEPAMATGPDAVVIVRSEYRISARNCPNFNPSNNFNPNEAVSPNHGCADAYNFGQMLARPRDAAVGREMGPADATVNAEAIQRYREGRVRSTTGGSAGAGASAGGSGGAAGAAGGAGGGVGGGGGGATTPAPAI